MSILNSVRKSLTCKRVTSPNVLHFANEKRNKGTFNDVTIEAGSETIAANRMILSCCSRFFEGMFDSEMKEKYQNPVQVNGVDGKSVKALIDFMYSGEVKINNENVMDLIAASDYLQIDEVKQFCFDYLVSILSSENWFTILSSATLYRNQNLENQVQDYISNNLKEIIESHTFKTLTKSALELFLSKLNIAKPEQFLLFIGLVTWTKYDENDRGTEFRDLFQQFVEFDSITVDFLKDTVLIEELVRTNVECLQVVTGYLVHKVEKLQMKKTALVSVGGSRSGKVCAETFSLLNKTPQKFPDLPISLKAHCSAKSDHHIYCIGGKTSDGNGEKKISISVWRLNLNDSVLNWRKVASLKQKRCVMGCAIFYDAVVVAGGFDGTTGLASVEYYLISINQWRNASSMKQHRNGCALVNFNARLYALGGWGDGDHLSSVEVLTDLNGNWKKAASMKSPRMWFAAVNCCGSMYAIGGRANANDLKAIKSVEKYDFASDKWILVCRMNFERNSHAACVMNGKIYVVGGLNLNGDVVREMECYDPLSDSWTIVGKCDFDLFNHSIIAV